MHSTKLRSIRARYREVQRAERDTDLLQPRNDRARRPALHACPRGSITDGGVYKPQPSSVNGSPCPVLRLEAPTLPPPRAARTPVPTLITEPSVPYALPTYAR